MVHYELYCKIKDCHDREGLTVAQIARRLHLDERTVARWLAMEKFCKGRSNCVALGGAIV